MAKILLQIFLLSIICKINAQTINVYSISAARQTGGDNGYTLDGFRMMGARAKLLDTANFGSGGVYPKSISITDSYNTTGSLTQVSAIPINSIFFFGSFNLLDASTNIFNPAEIDSLYNWSLSGGKLIIAESPTVAVQCNMEILNSKWNFSMNFSTPSYFFPTSYGNSTDIFNGPFGNVFSAYQGGSDQGYFNSIPSNAKILATDANDNTTLYLDCNTLDLVIADVDGYTDLGGVSSGSGISSYQDRFWVNTIAYMDKLQNPPIIINNGINLSCTNIYSNYQWYLNGGSIQGATNQTYSATQNGSYSVEATLDCGCKVFSNEIVIDTIFPEDILIVPNVFDPNNPDPVNQIFYVMGTGIKYFDLIIYNRWGQKVFETDDIKQRWDGTFNGKKLSSAVFVYYIKATYYDGREVERKGDVTLIR